MTPEWRISRPASKTNNSCGFSSNGSSETTRTGMWPDLGEFVKNLVTKMTESGHSVIFQIPRRISFRLSLRLGDELHPLRRHSHCLYSSHRKKVKIHEGTNYEPLQVCKKFHGELQSGCLIIPVIPRKSFCLTTTPEIYSRIRFDQRWSPWTLWPEGRAAWDFVDLKEKRPYLQFRVYHPAGVRSGGVGLISDKLSIKWTAEKRFEFNNGEENPPTR